MLTMRIRYHEWGSESSRGLRWRVRRTFVGVGVDTGVRLKSSDTWCGRNVRHM